VSRVVTVIDAGRIINPLAGRNQIEGAVVMGVGMALFDADLLRSAERRADQQHFRRLHRGGERDAPPIDVHFLEYPDKEINPVGARGIGEIGLAGMAAAITARSTRDRRPRA